MKYIFGDLRPHKRHFYIEVLNGRYAGWPSYLFALTSGFLAFGLRQWIGPVAGARFALALIVPAILASSILGGMGPGVLALALSVSFAVMMAPTHGVVDTAALIVVYGVTGGLIFGMGELVRRSWRDKLQAEHLRDMREAQIRQLLQSVPDAAIVVDSEGRIITLNTEAERQFGYVQADIIGQNVNILMPQPYKGEHDGYLRRYRETGEKRVIGKGRLVTAQRRDGSIFPISLSVGEFRSDDTLYFTGFIRDLTDRATAEAELKQLHGELARLSRLNELGEMASTLAHELNQPLSAIANYVQGSLRLLHDVEFTNAPLLRTALDEAAKQSLRAGKIIHHLREAATHGVTELKAESLRSIIEEAAALALSGSREQGIHTVFDYAASEDAIFVDRVQIQQVLINLIRNASEAMNHSGRRELHIVTRDASTPNRVSVDVADTGPGISADIAQQLFSPFVTSKPGGMGIGLAISRRIIEAHDGEIGVFRNDDGGATFRFTLPTTPIAPTRPPSFPTAKGYE